jgi:hypothetical protein
MKRLKLYVCHHDSNTYLVAATAADVAIVLWLCFWW